MLSQQYGEPPRLQPCAYYSKKLTPAEQNYDIGNRELLHADALSRIYSPDSPTGPEPILPPVLIVNPIVWNIDEDIRAAILAKPAPLGGPEGKTFVPPSQRQSLLGSVHNVRGSGHPGNQQTLSLLQARYWWPSMSRDTIRYVRSCSVCAMSSTPRYLPASLYLSPFLVDPGHTWGLIL